MDGGRGQRSRVKVVSFLSSLGRRHRRLRGLGRPFCFDQSVLSGGGSNRFVCTVSKTSTKVSFSKFLQNSDPSYLSFDEHNLSPINCLKFI